MTSEHDPSHPQLQPFFQSQQPSQPLHPLLADDTVSTTIDVKPAKIERHSVKRRQPKREKSSPPQPPSSSRTVVFMFGCNGYVLNPIHCMRFVRVERTDLEAAAMRDLETSGDPDPSTAVSRLHEMLHGEELTRFMYERVKDGDIIDASYYSGVPPSRAYRTRVSNCIRVAYRRPETGLYYCKACQASLTRNNADDCKLAALLCTRSACTELLARMSVMPRFTADVTKRVSATVATAARTHFVTLAAKALPVGDATAQPLQAAIVVNPIHPLVTMATETTPAISTTPTTPVIATPTRVMPLDDGYSFRMPAVPMRRGFDITDYATFVYIYKQMPWFIAACCTRHGMAETMTPQLYEALNRCCESSRTGVIYDHFYDKWPGFITYATELFPLIPSTSTVRVASSKSKSTAATAIADPTKISRKERDTIDVSLRNSQIQLLRYTNDKLLVVFSSPFERALFARAAEFHERHIAQTTPSLLKSTFCYYESGCDELITAFCSKCNYPRLIEVRVALYTYQIGACANCEARTINLARLRDPVHALDPTLDLDCVTNKNMRVVDPRPAADASAKLYCTLRMPDEHVLLPFARDARSRVMPRLFGVYDNSNPLAPKPVSFGTPPPGYQLQAWLVPTGSALDLPPPRDSLPLHQSLSSPEHQSLSSPSPPRSPSVPFASPSDVGHLNDSDAVELLIGLKTPSPQSPPTPVHPSALYPARPVGAPGEETDSDSDLDIVDQ